MKILASFVFATGHDMGKVGSYSSKYEACGQPNTGQHVLYVEQLVLDQRASLNEFFLSFTLCIVAHQAHFKL